MSGSIVVVGLGPGGLEYMAPAARQAIEQAGVIMGYKTYLDLIPDLAPLVRREGSGMRQEVSRVNRAIELARAGERVALISSGDAGIYGMAGLVYEMLHEQGDDHLPVEVIPGISALNAAAALLGAPLMTDFAAISLSDQLVPLEEILRRLELAARAGFVLCLYNPKGRKRVAPFNRACQILAQYRPAETPVGLVRAAYRAEQQVELTTLAALPQAAVDMLTIVVVGGDNTYLDPGRHLMVTRRGYGSKYDLGGPDEGD